MGFSLSGSFSHPEQLKKCRTISKCHMLDFVTILNWHLWAVVIDLAQSIGIVSKYKTWFLQINFYINYILI